LLLEQTRRRLDAQDVAITFSPAAIDWIADRGYQPEFGARPMRRAIQRDVDNTLSNMLLAGELPSGSTAAVDTEGGDLTVTVTSPAPVPS
jgi:ATP-dependent Clp protease ATP-binding subunit ClpC